MRILIFCLPGLGDTLMFTPVIRLLKKSLKQAQIEAVTMFKSSHDILKNNSFLDKIYLFNFLDESFARSFKYTSVLRRKSYDMSIVTFPAYRREYHLLSFLVGAKRRVAHRFKKGYLTQLNFLNTDTVLVKDNLHNVMNNLNLLQPLEITWQEKIKQQDIKYDIFLKKDDLKFGQDFVKKIKKKTRASKVVAFHIGSMKYKGNDLKRWPERSFIKVGKWILKEYNAAIILPAGSYERVESEQVRKEIGEKNSFVVSLPIRKVASILKNCDLFLGNDSGVAHLAGGLDISTIVLFGITNSRRCRPWGKNVHIIKSPNCHHCFSYSDKKFYCKIREGRKCINFITEDQVKEKIRTLSIPVYRS